MYIRFVVLTDMFVLVHAREPLPLLGITRIIPPAAAAAAASHHDVTNSITNHWRLSEFLCHSAKA